jgi:microcystin-dependent protein
MSEAFIGEIKMFAFNFAPRSWAFTNGQLLPIAQNSALFALLGTTYGGNGTTIFALPNLQDRTPIHQGTLAPNSYTMGQQGGAATHSLTVAELPSHSHGISATTAVAPATPVGPENAQPASGAHQPYRSGTVQNVALKTGLVASSGQSAPHENRQPYLVLNFCIALQGIFPSRN